MPFKSKAQMRAAFGGYLGPEMKSKAGEWAKETPSPKRLPEHAKKSIHNDHLGRAISAHLKTGK